MTVTHGPLAPGRLRVPPAVRHAALVIAGFTILFCWVFGRPLRDGTYLAESDLYDYYLPIFLSPPLAWSGYELGGMPAFADPENSTFYVLHLLFARVIESWTGFIASAYVLGSCLMYAYVYHHTRSAAAAAFSGVAFGLSEAMLERMAHPTIVHVLAWLPLLLLSIDRVRSGPRRGAWTAAGGFAAGMCVLAGHPQVPVYLAYLCSAYVLTGGLADRWPLAAWGAAGAVAVTGALLAGVILLPLAEAAGYMSRQTVDFVEFVSYSNTPAEMLSVFFPSISHVGREAPTYVGLLALMLSPLGVRTAGWRGAFWASVAMLALALGAGAATPLARVAYELPMYDNFRIVARHLVFAAFALAALAGFGVAGIQRRAASVRAVAMSAAAVLAAMAAAAGAMVWRPEAFTFESVNEALALPFWNSGIWLQLGFGLAAASLCVLFRVRPTRAVAALLLAFAAGDSIRALPGRATLGGLDLETVPRQALEPSVHARRIDAELDAAGQRLMTPGGAQTNEIVPVMFSRPWKIPIADGNSSVVVESMSRLAMLPRLRSGDRSPLESRNTALDLLAVRYLVFRENSMSAGERALMSDAARWRAAGRVTTSRVTDRGGDEDAAGEQPYLVFENLRALPRAWLAQEVLPLSDGAIEDAIFGSRLRDGRPFEPGRVALVDEGQFPARTHGDGQREVGIESVGNGSFRFRVSSRDGGFLVLSETYYPGWRARIDGGPPQPVYRTNMALQGIEVPPGEHSVSFEFVPRSRQMGLLASAVGLLLVVSMAVFGVLTSARRADPTQRRAAEHGSCP